MTRRRRLLQPILEEVYAQFRVLQKIIGTRLNHPQKKKEKVRDAFSAAAGAYQKL
jgi:hypothetical protein